VPDFSVIAQDPTIRALVQDNALERAIHDSLFPNLLFRGEADAKKIEGNTGDTRVFTGVGLIPKRAVPLMPGQDAPLVNYQSEQWSITLQKYGNALETDAPTSMVAIADLFLRNAQQLGLHAGQSLNAVARNRLYAAAESGSTVVDGTAGNVTVVRVKRLNGFTRARNPALAAGSPVQFQSVSTNNPLAIKINGTARNVVAFTSDNPGDEVGPGTITIDVALVVADRQKVESLDKTFKVFVGGGARVDDISVANVLTMASIRAMVARFRTMNVPRHADGYFHVHLDPTSENQIFGDNEFQRLHTSLPDSIAYKELVVSNMMNCLFFSNSECPQLTTVGGAGLVYDPNDPFAGELINPSGVNIHRVLFTGQEGLKEYYVDLSGLVTDAGLNGKVGEPRITNNGIEIDVERVQMIFRAPLDRHQDKVSTAWKAISDWAVRTDVTTGDAARYKRIGEILHAEA
jgi:hypothetical protein